jgi:hypothetical protein
MSKILNNFNIVLIAVILILAGYCLRLKSKVNAFKATIITDTVTISKTDTTWRVRDSIVYQKKLVPDTSIVPELNNRISVLAEITDSTNFNNVSLSNQIVDWSNKYTELYTQLKTKHIYKNRYSLGEDSSYADVIDTVVDNELHERLFSFHLSQPEITNTTTTVITKILPESRRLYIGGGFHLGSGNIINSVKGGLLYKDRHRIYSLEYIKNISGVGSQYGAGIYFPIK